MVHILWEFVVAPEHRDEFERHYGPNGSWAQLFLRSPQYRGTVLYRDLAWPGHYLTVDEWFSEEAFEAFKQQFADEYRNLDEGCEFLTKRETCMGCFEVL